MQTNVPAATYAASSQELAVFTQINDFRAKLGLGLVAQNPKLDTAGQNHMKYLMTNKDIDFSAVDPKTGRPFFHLENHVRPDFTGITERDRANYAQYGGAFVGELGAYGKGLGGGEAIDDLIATVYHRAGLMYQAPREIGVAVATDKWQTMVINVGYQSKGQSNASDYFGAYPADKQTNVRRSAYIETPNPFPEVAYADFGTKTSYPINVVSKDYSAVSVTRFTVTEAGQTTALDARLLTKETDPNKVIQANSAYLVGKAAFKANTTYNVSFVGTVNGAPMKKDWSFTTGN